MKKIYLLFLLVLALFAAGCESNTDSQVVKDNSKTIEITSSGFSPNELTINLGDTVTWINNDNIEHWPASAMHPTHKVYPGVNYEESGSYEGSEACKSEGNPKDGSFDPCKKILLGESWSFTFNQKGTWFYHDHLNPKLFGKIIVN